MFLHSSNVAFMLQQEAHSSTFKKGIWLSQFSLAFLHVVLNFIFSDSFAPRIIFFKPKI